MSELLEIYRTLKSKTWVDLTHQINENSPHFPALPALEKKALFTHEQLPVKWTMK